MIFMTWVFVYSARSNRLTYNDIHVKRFILRFWLYRFTGSVAIRRKVHWRRGSRSELWYVVCWNRHSECYGNALLHSISWTFTIFFRLVLLPVCYSMSLPNSQSFRNAWSKKCCWLLETRAIPPGTTSRRWPCYETVWRKWCASMFLLLELQGLLLRM